MMKDHPTVQRSTTIWGRRVLSKERNIEVLIQANRNNWELRSILPSTGLPTGGDVKPPTNVKLMRLVAFRVMYITGKEKHFPQYSS